MIEQSDAEYLHRVQAYFDDLPAAERVDLLDDVAEHLAETADETDGSLADLLGPPERYAADLRAAADLPPYHPAPTTARHRIRRGLVAVDLRAGRLAGYERFSDLARNLAPAWWVLRGYAAAAAVLWALDKPSVIPTIGGSAVAGGLITAATIAVSVRLGRFGPPRLAAVRALVGTAQVALLGLLVGVAVQATNVFEYYNRPQYPVEAVPPPVEDVSRMQACQLQVGDRGSLLVWSTTGLCPEVGAIAVEPSPAPSPS